MKKRKFGSGGMNAPAVMSGLGAASQMPQVIMQAPVTPPSQTSLYNSPVGTFPRAGFKKGGKIGKAPPFKKRFPGKQEQATPDASSSYKKGGKVKSGASKRGDGIATKGKTKGRFV